MVHERYGEGEARAACCVHKQSLTQAARVEGGHDGGVATMAERCVACFGPIFL